MIWLITHYISTVFMCGLIWLVQLVHYPYFKYVSEEDFVIAQNFHMKYITIIVMPIMLIELFTGIYLLVSPIAEVFQGIIFVNFALLVLIWLSTHFLSVPLHNKLTIGKNEGLINDLTKSNWPRTILWTGRTILLSYLFYKLLPGTLNET